MTYIWRCDIQDSIKMGGGGKGSSGGTTTSTTAPPEWLSNAYQSLLGQAQGVASTPYQPYTGQLVAPFTQDQVTAGNTIAGTQGMTQPYTAQATSDVNAGSQPIYPQVQQANAANINQYMSPYTQDVINSTMALANQNDAQQQSSLMGKAIQSGASPFGGDRAGVAAAALAGQQNLANNQTIANLNNQNYSQALGELNNQQQLQANTQASDAWRQLSAGQELGGLGTQAQSNTLGQASAQLQSGALQQQLAQENLNVPYEQYLAQQAYPFQTTNWLAGIENGIGGSAGGTSSTTSPSASTASQLGGLGLTGLGIYGLSGGFSGGASNPVSGATGNNVSGGSNVSGASSSWWPFKTGGVVGKHYDTGGLIAPEPIKLDYGIPNVSTNYIPSVNMNSHGNLPAPPKSEDSSGSSPLSGLSSLGGASALKGILGKLGGGSLAASGSGATGGIGDIFSSNEGGSFGGDTAMASQAANDSNFLGAGNVGSTFGLNFNRGGVAHKAFGGQLLPILGNIAGAFFGDPGAGSQAQLGMDMLDKLKKGGVAGHYDTGGMITTPQQAAVAGMNPMQQQQSSQYDSMSLDQLMQMATMQPNNPQIQKAIQQKKMGSGSMASGGVMPHFDEGGATDNSAVQDLQNIARGVASGDPVAQLDSNPQANGGGSVNSSDLLPPDAKGIAAPAAFINHSSQSLPTPEGELDAKPAVDHSGDTVKLHSEGKVIDTGLPSFKDSSVSSSAWEPLLAAGLGIMAGRSPNALTNIGEGGLIGLKAAGEQRAEALKENQAQVEAQKLKDDLDFRNKQLQQTGQYQTGELANRQAQLDFENKKLNTITPYEQAQLDLGKFVPVKDVFGNVTSLMNAKTGEIKPVSQTGGQLDQASDITNQAPSSNPQDAAAQILAEQGTAPAQVMSRQDITGRNAQVTAYNNSALSAKKAIQELDALNAQTGKYTPGKVANWLYGGESAIGQGGNSATARVEADKASKNLANAFMQANAGSKGSGIRMVEFDAGAVPNADMPDAARNELVAKNKAIANSQIQRAAISNLYPHMQIANVNAIMDNYEQKNPPIMDNGSANPKWMPYQDWLKAGRPNTASLALSGDTQNQNAAPALTPDQIQAIKAYRQQKAQGTQ